jgi:N4-gp56 family major capsid protein
MSNTIINPINNTSTATLHTTLQNYCDSKLLSNMKDVLVYHANAVHRPLPHGNGKTVEFWRYNKLGAVTTPLEEAVVPTAQTYSQAKITATIESFGAYLAVSDQLNLTAINFQIAHLTKMLADQAAVSVDTLTRDVMLTGTNVLYSGGKTARASITAEDNLKVDDIRRAVRILEKQGAPKFSRGGKGYYKCIIGPDAKFALQSDPKWLDVANYQQAEKIENGEIGKLYGVIFIETSNNKIYVGAGAPSTSGGSDKADVDTAFVFGDESYATIALGDAGANAHIIAKTFGSAGTADPLNQACTLGWKVDGMKALILNNNWLLRIESAVAA